MVGGHEIRQGSFLLSAEEFRKNSGVFEPELIDACREDLEAASDRVRPGYTAWARARRSIDWATGPRGLWPRTAKQAIDRIASDLLAFAAKERVDHLIVLNVASTEPPFQAAGSARGLVTLNQALDDGEWADLLPSSSLYAAAAIREGFSYINFTPSLGASVPALEQLAGSTGSLLAGKDGKTGETLMKTVLAPMFAQRNLEVLSWVGHNIFGNRDGVVLDDPANKASKVTTKDQVVTEILGYKPFEPGLDRVHPRHGGLEDGLGPYSLPGFSGLQDDTAVHVAGLR